MSPLSSREAREATKAEVSAARRSRLEAACQARLRYTEPEVAHDIVLLLAEVRSLGEQLEAARQETLFYKAFASHLAAREDWINAMGIEPPAASPVQGQETNP